MSSLYNSLLSNSALKCFTQSVKQISTTSVVKNKQISLHKYEIVFPHKVSRKKTVGDGIPRPSYYSSGLPDSPPKNIEIKNELKIRAIKNSCSLASSILKSLRDFIKVGITTDEIDTFVHDICIENRAYPSPLNYHHFPKSVCTSVNNVACHGIPDSRPLKDGDILNVDVTVFREDMHGDCSAMFMIGDVDEGGRLLCAAAEEALLAGISVCKPQTPFSLIGKLIEEVVRDKGFSVVPAFAGHGIGSYFHGLPDIYHFGDSKCILRYLQETKDLGLIYSKGEDKLKGYSDADHANDPDNRRSVSGFMAFYAGNPISWNSRKQSCVAISTMDAEYMAAGAAAAELTSIPDTTGTHLDSGRTMQAGMTFTIEPVLSEGGSEITILEDGWTAVTTDSSRTAQWEHTLLITNDGFQILTL